MADEQKTKLRLEIAHVLFLDIVGYSKLLIDEQSEALQELNQIVRNTEAAREAEAAGQLIILPTGDGMALVFTGSVEDPVECALQVSQVLRAQPRLPLRVALAGNAKRSPVFIMLLVVGLMLFTLAVHGIIFAPAILKQIRGGKTTAAPSTFAEGPTTSIDHGPSLAAVVSPAAAPEKSIAVLPFENMSRDPDNAFFTDGVQDQILTALAKVADLKVISRTSVMQYKTGTPRNTREIGQQLGVAHLLEGTVQRAGNKVRVNAQLIDARSDAHEWAENYDRPVDDVFAIQSEIAKKIAEQLQAKLSPTEKSAIEEAPTKDVAAFDLYTRAKTLLLTTSFSALAAQNYFKAVDLLDQALTRDPSVFLAQCQLAYVHDNMYFLGIDHTPARLAAADSAVNAAFKLRPDGGEAHLARAEHLYRGYLDYDGALAELEIARRTLPNDPRVFELTGYIARRRGNQEEGLRNLQRAIELDPRNFFTLEQIALSYLNLRRYADEAAVLDRALAIKPDDVDTRVVRALIPFDAQADPRPLRDTIEKIRAADPEAIKSVADSWVICALAQRDAASAESALRALGDNDWRAEAVRVPSAVIEGVIGRMTKNEDKARAAFTAARAVQEKRVQEQPEWGPALCVLGLIDAGLGRKEDALREGRRAVELLPAQKDALNGAHMIEYFAIIAAWVGEKDLACKQLATVAPLDSTSISYGQLKLLPYWDPLRGDPRFEKIVASLAPK